jgi:hypothetical protein
METISGEIHIISKNKRAVIVDTKANKTGEADKFEAV